jgi:hypothetical protein
MDIGLEGRCRERRLIVRKCSGKFDKLAIALSPSLQISDGRVDLYALLLHPADFIHAGKGAEKIGEVGVMIP